MRLVLVSESSTGRSHDAVPLIVGNSLTSPVSTKLGTVQSGPRERCRGCPPRHDHRRCAGVPVGVLTGNARAQSFYRRHGFAPDGTRLPVDGLDTTKERWVRLG